MCLKQITCNGSVKKSFATDCEQNSETWKQNYSCLLSKIPIPTSSAVCEIVPDKISGFSLLGAIGILNIFVRSSSGSGSYFVSIECDISNSKVFED